MAKHITWNIICPNKLVYDQVSLMKWNTHKGDYSLLTMSWYLCRMKSLVGSRKARCVRAVFISGWSMSENITTQADTVNVKNREKNVNAKTFPQEHRDGARVPAGVVCVAGADSRGDTWFPWDCSTSLSSSITCSSRLLAIPSLSSSSSYVVTLGSYGCVTSADPAAAWLSPGALTLMMGTPPFIFLLSGLAACTSPARTGVTISSTTAGVAGLAACSWLAVFTSTGTSTAFSGMDWLGHNTTLAWYNRLYLDFKTFVQSMEVIPPTM